MTYPEPYRETSAALRLHMYRPGKLLTAKRYRVLPCSNATHQFEVYAVVHGGWGHAGTPKRAVALARAQQRCNAAFARRFGGPIRVGYGWEAFWPDPGAEARRYADRIVCSLIRFPGHPAMGVGTHFRRAVGR